MGVYVVDTIVTASYSSPGDCEFYDVTIDCQNLVPYVSGMGLELHVLSTPNFVTIDGNPISVGTVLPISQQNSAFEVDFVIAGSVEFAIIASGTPSLVGQEVPCWIEIFQTLAICSNSMQLNWGESLVPCTVQPAVGVDENQVTGLEMKLGQNGISVNSNERGILSVFSLDGRQIISKEVQPGFTFLGVSSLAEGTYLVRFEGRNTLVSKKILLQ